MNPAHDVAFAAATLARGDLSAAAARFAEAGIAAVLPAPGVLQLSPQHARPASMRLLLSCGVHGDETAPLEMVAALLAQLHGELVAEPSALAVELMVAVGNPDAIAAGRRFVEADLNRMFGDERGALATAAEAARADVLMHAAAAFFAAGQGSRWHLDLHSAIRASRYPTFAVVPDVGHREQSRLLAWLARAGIEAAILSQLPGSTFSAWSARRHGALSATLELGRVAALGHTDLARFAAMHTALGTMLREGAVLSSPGQAPLPVLFRAVQELRKRSEGFHPFFDPATPNFTRFAAGSAIAEDGDVIYRAGARDEYIVFPNPDVRVGLRAGVMVVREDEQQVPV